MRQGLGDSECYDVVDLKERGEGTVLDNNPVGY